LVQDKAAGFFRPTRKDHGIFDRRSAPTSRIEKNRERSIVPKDAVSGWTQTIMVKSFCFLNICKIEILQDRQNY